MSLEERITSAMREAMKARDADRVSTLRMAMAAATNRRIELGHTLTDEDTIGVLDKQVKQRRESAELFRSGGRPELADREEAEIAVLTEFLPAPLTDAEIDALIAAAIRATGAATPADMGKVMGVVAPQTKGRADGRAVSDKVKAALAG
jgi:uncharacterized protein YqeY